jgi:predicted Zn-dependent protease
VRLAEIAAARGDVKESYADCQRAVRLQPSDSSAEIGLAKALASMNQPDKAIAILEQVVQHDPANALAHFRLSTLYRQAGRTADAQRELEEYQKCKQMKEKLSDIYKQMRIHSRQVEDSATDAKR